MGRQTRTLTSARATYDALNTAPESLGSESGKALLAALGTAQVAYRSAAPPVVKTGRTLESKLIRFMQQGPHIDYPEREVMYRWDADTNTMFQKYCSQRLSADGASIQISDGAELHPAAQAFPNPDLEVFWNDDESQIAGDTATYELQVYLLLKSIKHKKVSAGLYVANSARAVWRNEADGVTVTTDPDTLASIPGQLLAPALAAAGIAYGEAAPAAAQ